MLTTQLLKALSDENRLLVTLVLQQRGELCVCDLTALLPLSQPAVSRHLAQLKRCGLLADRRQGKWVYYRLLDDSPLWLQLLLAQLQQQDEIQARLTPLLQTSSRASACC